MATEDQAISQAVIVELETPNPNIAQMRLALFDDNGNRLSFLPGDYDPMGAALPSNYVPGPAAAIDPETDNLIGAIAKLDARIAALESA